MPGRGFGRSVEIPRHDRHRAATVHAMTRLPLRASLVLVALLASAAPADGRARCAPAKTRLVEATAQIRLVERTKDRPGQYIACDMKTGKSVVMGRHALIRSDEESMMWAKIVGRRVYFITRYSGPDYEEDGVWIAEPARRRVVGVQTDLPVAAGENPTTTITRMLVTGTGALAWTAERAGKTIVVSKTPDGEPKLHEQSDSGDAGIDPSSLALAERFKGAPLLYWTTNGQVRSAELA